MAQGRDRRGVGNQLIVLATGSWNTIIIDAVQTNTGDVTAATSLTSARRPNDPFPPRHPRDPGRPGRGARPDRLRLGPPPVNSAGLYARPIGTAPATPNAALFPGHLLPGQPGPDSGRRSPVIAVDGSSTTGC